jgi:hypothetical protein
MVVHVPSHGVSSSFNKESYLGKHPPHVDGPDMTE